MNTPFSLPLATGVYVVPLLANSAGAFEITLRCLTAPTGGTMLIEGQPYGSSGFVTIGGASAIPLTTLANVTPIQAADFGHFAALRFTLIGVIDGSHVIAGTAGPVHPTGLPDGVANGQRALNVQTFAESASKIGNAFYLQYMLPTLAASATNKIVFTTGANPVVVNDREFYVFGASVSIQLFKQPTGISGGTALTVQNYNDINPAVSTVAVKALATVSANGTSWGDPVHVYNSSTGATGSRAGQMLNPNGGRVLKANSTYLVVITNNDVATAQADYYLSWTEGVPDLPRQ